MQDAIIRIKLKVPNKVGPAYLEDYVAHWLEEGYFAKDHLVELPDGIRYKGFDVEWPNIR